VVQYFIAGTDTGVGKTLVACALLHQFRRLGYSTAGMKPVAAGGLDIGQEFTNEDVVALRDASSIKADKDLLNPYLLKQAVAPHIAAAQEGIAIDLAQIRLRFEALAKLAAVVIVEGVGGFRVPLNSREDSGDLAVMLGIPVVLVVGMRLGCLSHALLTQEAVLSRNLRLSGWVANRIDPNMPKFEENVEALRERFTCPLLGTVAHLERPDPAKIDLRTPT
jgi:dethiobiotin synthetase